MKFLKTYTFFLALLVATLFSSVSHALVEVRVTYGGIKSDDFVKNVCDGYCTTDIPAFIPLAGAGADIIVSPPLTDFGFGVRYEKFEISAETPNLKAEAKLERIAALLNYRLINTIIHFGPIFTYGLSQSAHLMVIENSNPRINFEVSKIESATAGLELGVKPLLVVPLSFGLEGGYQYLNLIDAKDTVNNVTKSLDLSGIYIKAFIGLDF